jgi:hypothetical protein
MSDEIDLATLYVRNVFWVNLMSTMELWITGYVAGCGGNRGQTR